MRAVLWLAEILFFYGDGFENCSKPHESHIRFWESIFPEMVIKAENET
jgi:hypothetical protein